MGSAAADSTATEVRSSSELRHLLHHDCGSCHGMRLTGGLGPALTPEALEGKPDAYLLMTIQEGHAGTPMPPWKYVLAESEVRWLIEELRNPGEWK